MFLVLLLTILFLYPKPSHALAPDTIPLYYQLLSAYRSPLASSLVQSQSPGSVLGLSTSNTIASPTPSPSTTPKVTTPAPTQAPTSIGGNGQLTTIALLGDSMIDTLNLDHLQSSLQQYFPNRKFEIFDYGVGSSDIEYALYRLKNDYRYQGQLHKALLSLKPDIIVIESFAYNNFGNTQDGFNRQWLALGAITTEIKNNLPDTKILLTSTIAPQSSHFANGSGTTYTAIEKIEKTSTIKLYLQKLNNFASSQGFPLADAYTPSLDSKGQGLTDLISSSDHIHPSELGSQFFSDIISRALFEEKLLD